MPFITPVVALTVATAILALVHVPPPGLLANVVVAPSQTEAVPVIAAGNGFTVMILVL